MAEEGLVEVVDPGVQGGDVGAEFLGEGSEILTQGSHFLAEGGQILVLETKQGYQGTGEGAQQREAG